MKLAWSLRHRLVGATILWGLRVSDAAAHPWMIREGYTGCATCHADPSGSGLLTAYGRAQSELLLSTFPTSRGEEPSKAVGAFLGALPEPESGKLLYSLAYRGGLFVGQSEGTAPAARHIVMQADARAQWYVTSRLRVNGSAGFVPAGGQLAALLPDRAVQLVSREHWVGVDLGEDRDWLLRAGRIALPYGVRGNEHPFWSRNAVRADTAFQQQHGLALARTTDGYRAELMVVLGNYQVTPDLYRERGYAGYFEHVFSPHLAAGVSSSLMASRGDLYRSRRQPVLRHAHGVFARWAVAQSAVLLAQTDVLSAHPSGADATTGAAGFAQLDLQLLRGVHLMPALEAQQPRFDQGAANLGAWVSLAFFPYAHMETRVDLVGRSMDTPAGRSAAVSGLFALHMYL